MSKPCDVLPELFKAYVEACIKADNDKVEPDFSEVNRIMQTIPIKHREDYVYFANEFESVLIDNLCKHREVEGDERTEKQICKTCGMQRHYHWVKDSHDEYGDDGHYEWGGWHRIVTQACKD